MNDVTPKIEAFFADARSWREELGAMRAILLDTPLTEEFKWRSPCYTFQGTNVAMVFGLKDNCGLSFFKGVLLTDTAGLLTAPGENSRSGRVARFTDLRQIVEAEADLKDLVRQAIAVEEAGLKVDLPPDDFELPEELVERLETDRALKAAFEALTPGRRRGYALHFGQPKQSATRMSRIEKCAPRILAGKGMHDR